MIDVSKILAARVEEAHQARLVRVVLPGTGQAAKTKQYDVTRKPRVFDSKGVARETHGQRSNITSPFNSETLDCSTREPSYSAIVYDRNLKRWVSNSWVPGVSNSVSNSLNRVTREVRHDGRQAHSQAVNRHGSGNF